MEAYKHWVRSNQQWLSSIESLANTLTWLLPERFASSELAPEGLSTLIGLLTTLNQHIVDTAPRGPPRGHPGAPEAPASREQGKVPWGLWVAIMKEVEVLGEMAAAQVYGEDGKWGPIAAIEAVKALLRLVIFQRSHWRMLLGGGEDANEEEEDETAGASASSQQPRQRGPVQPPGSGGPPGWGRGWDDDRAHQGFPPFLSAPPPPPAAAAAAPFPGHLGAGAAGVGSFQRQQGVHGPGADRWPGPTGPGENGGDNLAGAGAAGASFTPADWRDPRHAGGSAAAGAAARHYMQPPPPGVLASGVRGASSAMTAFERFSRNRSGQKAVLPTWISAAPHSLPGGGGQEAPWRLPGGRALPAEEERRPPACDAYSWPRPMAGSREALGGSVHGDVHGAGSSHYYSSGGSTALGIPAEGQLLPGSRPGSGSFHLQQQQQQLYGSAVPSLLPRDSPSGDALWEGRPGTPHPGGARQFGASLGQQGHFSHHSPPPPPPPPPHPGQAVPSMPPHPYPHPHPHFQAGGPYSAPGLLQADPSLAYQHHPHAPPPPPPPPPLSLMHADAADAAAQKGRQPWHDRGEDGPQPCSDDSNDLSEPSAATGTGRPLAAGSMPPPRWPRRCQVAGELLHVLRPLVYVLAIRKYGIKSWKPWLLSAAVDLSSLALISGADLTTWARQPRGGPGAGGEKGAPLSAPEQTEMLRRKTLLLLYLLRSPCFDQFTRRPVEGMESALKSLPLIGTLAEKGLELLLGIQSIYFYTAAS